MEPTENSVVENVQPTSEPFSETKRGFLSPEFVREAEAAHEFLQTSPEARKLSLSAQAAMDDVCAIFDGPTKDEDVEFLLGGPLSREELEALRLEIKGMNPGDYLLFRDKTFFLTADRKVQEGRAYVNRLEKAVVNAMRYKTDELSSCRRELAEKVQSYDALVAKDTRRKKRAVAKRKVTLLKKSRRRK